jgi:hypothetical protein
MEQDITYVALDDHKRSIPVPRISKLRSQQAHEVVRDFATLRYVAPKRIGRAGVQRPGTSNQRPEGRGQKKPRHGAGLESSKGRSIRI